MGVIAAFQSLRIMHLFLSLAFPADNLSIVYRSDPPYPRVFVSAWGVHTTLPSLNLSQWSQWIPNIFQKTLVPRYHSYSVSPVALLYHRHPTRYHQPSFTRLMADHPAILSWLYCTAHGSNLSPVVIKAQSHLRWLEVQFCTRSQTSIHTVASREQNRRDPLHSNCQSAFSSLLPHFR